MRSETCSYIDRTSGKLKENHKRNETETKPRKINVINSSISTLSCFLFLRLHSWLSYLVLKARIRFFLWITMSWLVSTSSWWKPKAMTEYDARSPHHRWLRERHRQTATALDSASFRRPRWRRPQKIILQDKPSEMKSRNPRKLMFVSSERGGSGLDRYEPGII